MRLWAASLGHTHTQAIPRALLPRRPVSVQMRADVDNGGTAHAQARDGWMLHCFPNELRGWLAAQHHSCEWAWNRWPNKHVPCHRPDMWCFPRRSARKARYFYFFSHVSSLIWDRQKDVADSAVRPGTPLAQSLVWGLQTSPPAPLRMLSIELEYLACPTLHDPEPWPRPWIYLLVKEWCSRISGLIWNRKPFKKEVFSFPCF